MIVGIWLVWHYDWVSRAFPIAFSLSEPSSSRPAGVLKEGASNVQSSDDEKAEGDDMEDVYEVSSVDS